MLRRPASIPLEHVRRLAGASASAKAAAEAQAIPGRPVDPLPHIAVVGPGSDVSPWDLSVATEVGSLTAARGAILMCGGLGGIGEAACRGARAHDGQCIGILPGTDRLEGNPYLTVGLPTGLGEMSSALVVRCSDVLIAVGGSWGTLSEVALALRLEKPVVALDTWRVRERHHALHNAKNAEDAVKIAFELLSGPGSADHSDA